MEPEIPDWELDLLTMLRLMNSTQEWGSGIVHFYHIPLIILGEVLAGQVIRKMMLTEKWRPQPSDIMERAVQIVAPLPPVAELWAEVRFKLPHADYRLPKSSHFALRQTIKRMGGWRFLYGQYWPDTHPAQWDALAKQFEREYAAVSELWNEDVIEQLQLPAMERDERYFAPYQKFVPPAPTKALPEHGARLTLTEILANMPESVLEQMRRNLLPPTEKSAWAGNEMRSLVATELEQVGGAKGKATVQ